MTDRRSHPEASQYSQDTPLTPHDVRRMSLSPTGKNSTHEKKGVLISPSLRSTQTATPESDDDHMYESASVSPDISLQSDELDI
jgi:hypothetical protein